MDGFRFDTRCGCGDLDPLPLSRGRSRDEMIVVVTAVAIALVALMGVIVTEDFDWFLGFLATGRVFFGEGRGLGGPGEHCVDMYNYNYGEIKCYHPMYNQ